MAAAKKKVKAPEPVSEQKVFLRLLVVGRLKSSTHRK